MYDRHEPQTDFESAETTAAWNGLARLLVEHDLAYLVDTTGARCDEAVHDEAGRILCRLIPIAHEQKPAPHARTLADVGGLDMDDAFDRAMADLPIYAALLDKAKAALLANIDGPTIQARLRCSSTLVSLARRELREELPEHEWPMSLSNSKAHSRQANLSRPNMSREAGSNPLQLRAKNLGVSEAEARMIATDNRNKTKFKEHTGGDAARNRRGRDR